MFELTICVRHYATLQGRWAHHPCISFDLLPVLLLTINWWLLPLESDNS